MEFDDFKWPMDKNGNIRHFVATDNLPVPQKKVEKIAEPTVEALETETEAPVVEVAEPVVEVAEPEKILKDIEMFECPKCGRSIRGRGAMGSHMRTHGIDREEQVKE